MMSPTLHDIFQQWKQTPRSDEMTWTDHWLNMWGLHIAMYINEGWHLIPIAPESKRPMERTHWNNDAPLDLIRANDFVRAGCNIAVVAKFSNLIIVESDQELMKLDFPRDGFNLTLTAKTPRGYAFFCKAPRGRPGPWKKRAWQKLKRRWGFDTMRDDVQYQLVPLSRTCVFDSHGGCNHPDKPHDYRVRTWISSVEHAMDFEQFTRVIT